MTLAIPDEIASRLTTLLPEAERDEFALSAITDALNLRQAENRLADLLLDEYDPAENPERETAECRAIVEAELADRETNGHNLLTLDEVWRQWREQETTAQAVK